MEFAYRYGRFFHGVHWLNAGSPAGLEAEVAACGAVMGLVPWPDKQPEQVARTLDAWRRGGVRLVVLDNLEEVEAAREWLGRLSGGGARVLVTARRQDWPRDLGLDQLRLEVFSEEESRAFLREYLGEERATEAEWGELAERLGYLPLALELAGRYLEGYPTLSVADYLGEFEDALSHVSMRAWDEERGSPTKHDLDVAATFELSWKRVSDEAACRVFLLTGHCAPNQPIPDDVLRQAAELDEKAYGRGVHVLVSMGLLKGSDSGPMIHPLLADFARALPDAAETLPALAGALATLTHQIFETGLPDRFAPLRSHVEAVVPAAEVVDPENAGVLWNNLSTHLQDVADYRGAREALERAIPVTERAYGADHPNVASCVNNLGGVLRDLGDLAGARGCHERALGIDERVYGPEHPEVATDVNNLGLVLRAQGDLAGARGCYERALGIWRAAYGEEHPQVATAHNNLGRVMHDEGDLAGARGCFERALAIREATLGRDHPDTAISLWWLGTLERETGDAQKARAYFEEALRVFERVYPPDHPYIERVRAALDSLEDQ